MLTQSMAVLMDIPHSATTMQLDLQPVR